MNATNINTFTTTEEQKKELQQQFRENLEYVETFQGIRVFTNTLFTFSEDMLDLATGYATIFDVEGNGTVEPIILLSKTALTSSHRVAILWHEHGHHALGHLDGRTAETARNLQEEVEADMWSYVNNGEDILHWLREVKEILKPLYIEVPSTQLFQDLATEMGFDPEEAARASKDAQDEVLGELDARIASLLNGGDISSLNQTNNGELL